MRTRVYLLVIAMTVPSCANLNSQGGPQLPICETAGNTIEGCGGPSPVPAPKPEPIPKPDKPDKQDKLTSVQLEGIYYHARVSCANGKTGIGASANRDASISMAFNDCNL